MALTFSACVKPESDEQRAASVTPSPSTRAALPSSDMQQPAAPPPAPSEPTSEEALLDEQEPPSKGDFDVVSGPQLLARIRASGSKATLVNAWASWCGPCRREFPFLTGLRKELQADGIDLVFVSVDEFESRADALAFAKEHGQPTPVVLAERPLGPFKKSLNPAWPGMLPATFLFDHTGRLRYFWGGPIYKGELMPVIRRFLAGEEIDGASNYALTPGRTFREPTTAHD